MRKYKGIVCEKKESYSVFLTEDGEFLRGTPLNRAVQIGEEVEFYLIANVTAPKRMKPIFIAPALIAAMLLIILVSSWFPQTTPAYAYINVEGDSKIEIGIDEDGKVISLHSTEGSLKDWEGQSLDLVLTKAVDQVGAEEKKLAVTTVYEKEDKPKLNKQIEKAVQKVQKGKPSSEKNSVEPKPKNPKSEAIPPGQIKKEEKVQKPNKEQKNTQKQFDNKESKNEPKSKKDTPVKDNEPKVKKEQQPKENKPSNNSNNIPGQEKKKGQEKSNNGNNPNKNNDSNNKDNPNKENKSNNSNKN
ncbi:anti-sigma factor domain-containing protein [Psychrobacillus sp. NPDC096623]|uniref:anti-sigma factor domain-containing protein n=1 Tax=Psychrobacillus sp. NPDC096623 TaxID=3364492 RepID=UPI003830B9DB